MHLRKFLSILLVLGVVLGGAPRLSAAGDDAEQIATLLNNMEQAVMAGDRDTYLTYIDQSDPVFALEHERWADDWAELHPVEKYDLVVDNLQIDGDQATGELTVLWVLKENLGYSHGATFPVIFRRGADGAWRYGGERWLSFETEHFIIRYLDSTQDAANKIEWMLPDIYELTTTSVNYTPSVINEIKLYETSDTLVANTLLSLPLIAGWNEPGEALKLVGGGSRVSTEYLQYVLTHEFIHKLTFDMADNSHGNFPWWTEEGIAEYVAMQTAPQSDQDAYLSQSQDWAKHGELADWETITVFEETPVELWDYVYPQGYAMIRYITETYGEKQRNEWLLAIAGEQTIDEASQSVLYLSFEELSQNFEAWLVE